MAGMAFGEGPESDWIVRGWIYRQVIEDLRAHTDLTPEVETLLKESEGIEFFNVGFWSDRSRGEICQKLQVLCEAMLSGAVSSGIYRKSWADPDTVDTYQRALHLLLGALAFARAEDGKPEL